MTKALPYRWIILLVGVVFLSEAGMTQNNAVVTGTVTDKSTGETLAGVNVVLDNNKGTTTSAEGTYTVHLTAGNHTLFFSFVGYEKFTKEVAVKQGDTVHLSVGLTPSAINLNTAVVTAGLYIQKLSDVSVSMTVIPSAYLEKQNTRHIETVFNQMPGIDILDGQASIRGGGGYSYGAGSRVLVVLDELPLLTADVGEVKWNFLPVENTAQVEIVKGASSSLYGSSALNGVINLRTLWPGLQPKTTVTLYSGIFDKPARKELSWWWDSNPMFEGFRFSHAHRFEQLDVVAGADLYGNAGYREKNYEQHARANIKLRYRPKNIKNLSAGISANIQRQNSSGFFLWRDADSGAWLQQPAGLAPTAGFRVMVDPWVNYFDKHQNKHSLLTRFYKVRNTFEQNPDKDNGSNMFYGEYRFHTRVKQALDITAGATGMYGSTRAALYGNHFNTNFALFTQVDYKLLQKLTLSGGYRAEYYSIDKGDEKISNVFRTGINYKAAGFTFLRASFGQGYRYPSIAEKYTATSVGSLNIFPNPDLKPEKGWSAEAGIKQGYRLWNITGFLDAALFWTEYNNMIEFTFGIYKPDSVEYPSLSDVGFKSLNVGKARINGVDITLSGGSKAGKFNTTFFIGYTYMNPVDLTSDTLENNILKYRYRHSVKGDVTLGYGRFSLGINMIYRSFMERIDPAFEEKIFGMEIMPGLKEYREENNKGAVIFDLRLAWQLTKAANLAFTGKNIFNKEYMGRPGDIRPPRNYALQLMVKF